MTAEQDDPAAWKAVLHNNKDFCDSSQQTMSGESHLNLTALTSQDQRRYSQAFDNAYAGRPSWFFGRPNHKFGLDNGDQEFRSHEAEQILGFRSTDGR